MQDRISLLGSGMTGVINATNQHFQLLLKDRPVDGKGQGLDRKEADVNAVPPSTTDRERDSMDKRNHLIPDARRAPCKTCGKHLGFQDDVPPYYIWCINNECSDYHAAFTPVEWQESRATGKNSIRGS